MGPQILKTKAVYTPFSCSGRRNPHICVGLLYLLWFFYFSCLSVPLSLFILPICLSFICFAVFYWFPLPVSSYSLAGWMLRNMEDTSCRHITGLHRSWRAAVACLSTPPQCITAIQSESSWQNVSRSTHSANLANRTWLLHLALVIIPWSRL